MTPVQAITSRANPLLARVRRLARHSTGYRKAGELWLEGEHLCEAWTRAQRPAPQAVIAESAWDQPVVRALAMRAARVARVPDVLFEGLSSLGSSPGIGFLVDAPGDARLDPERPTVVLDRVQDAGNVGSILRSAAAMGFTQVLAIEGTAGLWSPKVLRAAMGANFALQMSEGLAPDDLAALAVPMLATSSHALAAIDNFDLPWPCAWVFGHEGQGVDAALLARCRATVRVPQPGGQESLNVAAAAAICLYASCSQRSPA
ncbi:MAG: RNA methyltransferase [Aquincola sp.]|nr:RNA methyltransferase [Aquincola sp.]MDH4288369.1 RNA methyltransferase [Aquincola sp.]MDH5330832.1 RNA methyltransferase [Aquincola sp.]